MFVSSFVYVGVYFIVKNIFELISSEFEIFYTQLCITNITKT